jgi:hypothetical protein
MTAALPSGSAIGQSDMVALPSGHAIGQSGVSQDRLVGTWTYESIVVERTDGTINKSPTDQAIVSPCNMIGRVSVACLAANAEARLKTASTVTGRRINSAIIAGWRSYRPSMGALTRADGQLEYSMVVR